MNKKVPLRKDENVLVHDTGSFGASLILNVFEVARVTYFGYNDEESNVAFAWEARDLSMAGEGKEHILYDQKICYCSVV